MALLANIFSLNVFAQSSGSGAADQFYDALPPAQVRCRTGGSLQAFAGTKNFKSTQNTIFLDRENNQIGVRERVVDDTPGNKVDMDMFLKVAGVTKDNLVDLILKRKVVASKGASSDLSIRVVKDDGEKFFIASSKDSQGNPIDSTIFVQVTSLSNTTYKGTKYVLANGNMKLRLVTVPKQLQSDGSFTEVVDDVAGTIVCNFKGCPILNVNLEEKLGEFLGEDISSIINEGVGIGNTEDSPIFNP